MNDAGRLGRPGAGRPEAAPWTACSSSTTRSTCPSATCAPAWGAALAGHNGLKSLVRGLGSPDFARVRVGVGRPDSTDPEIVSSYVLGRFREPPADVAELVDDAARAAQDTVGA